MYPAGKKVPCRYVLHTVGPIIRTVVSPRDKVLLTNCYKNCLESASSHNLKSVAFCCISTGVFRFPANLAAKIAVETVKNWLNEHPEGSVKKVIFNVFGDKDLEIYKRILGTEVPLNQPGTNPYQLSQSERLQFVGKLEQ